MRYFLQLSLKPHCLLLALLSLSFGESRIFAQVHTSELPLLIFGIDEQEVPADDKAFVTLKIVSNNSGQLNRSDGPYDYYDGFAGIELRGSSSLSFPKRGYAIELRTVENEDLDFPLLGMPEEEDWVLHGPYSDKTLIRNSFTYNLAQSTSTWAPKSRFCEVLFGDDYRGVYLLVEKIKRDRNRLDLKKLASDDVAGIDLTGGYIIKVDKSSGEDPSIDYSFRLPIVSPDQGLGTKLIYHVPKPTEIVNAQKAYIESWMVDFEDRLAGPNFKDEQLGYRSLIDINSWIDFFFINEITRNVDGYRISTYLHKRRDDNGGKLYMGPVWDFNLGLGNADYCRGSYASGWALDFGDICPGDGFQVPFHYGRMLEDSVFSTRLAQRWEAYRNDQWSDDKLYGLFDSLASVIQQPAIENFNRYPILGNYIWPNNFVESDHQDAVSYARRWLTSRLRWLDREIPQLAPDQASFSIEPSISQGELEINGLERHHYPLEVELYSTSGQALFQQKLFSPREQISFEFNGLVFYKLRTVSGKLMAGKLFLTN